MKLRTVLAFYVHYFHIGRVITSVDKESGKIGLKKFSRVAFKMKDLENMEFVCDKDPYPTIPDGFYEAICFKHDKAFYGKSLKLFLHFKIIAPSEYKGTKLFLAFNMRSDVRIPQGSKSYKE